MRPSLHFLDACKDQELITKSLGLPALPLLNMTFYPLYVSLKPFYLFLLIVTKSPLKVFLWGDLPDPEIEPVSPALQADSLPTEPSGKPLESVILLFL